MFSTSIGEAYRKVGLDSKDLDFELLRIDVGTVAKDLRIRPKKSLFGYPVAVGPKDLLRVMGYTPEGHQLPIPTWNPGIKSNAFPNWIKADGVKAPKCLHDIKFVYATGNDVTPFIGFEKWEDIGISVRFFLPYVYINPEKKWFRLTGGTPSGDTGIFSIKHICALLRMTLEENSIKYKFGWARKYPQTAHDLLGQVYFRGLEIHAPAWTEYYKPGRSYNDIESFDVRKAEFSVEEMERKKRVEHRERLAKAALARVADLERRTILEDYSRGVAAENDEFRKKLRDDQLREQTQDLERAMARAEEEGQMRIAMSKAMEKARIMVDD